MSDELNRLAGEPIAGPVVIVAGGCDRKADVDWARFGELVAFSLEDFAGTLLSGGTDCGVGRIVGDTIEASAEKQTGFCWLPAALPTGTRIDERYADRRTALPADPDYATSDFTPAEPLRAWMTILASGIKPADVKMIGINGGRIAGFEYHFAAAIGANVGIVMDSGRVADQLSLDRDLPGNQKIRFLPADRETLRAFVERPFRSRFTDPQIRFLADQADATYHATVQRQTRAAWDKMLAEKPELARAFDKSNIDQIEHIEIKLARIGLKLIEIDARDQRPLPFEFTAEQVEILAEMEHGRWVVERTSNGWRPGPADNAKKQRPQLIAWNDPKLIEDEKEKDRAAVRGIPTMLETLGFTIRPA